MRRLITPSLLVLVAAFIAGPSLDAARVGEPAPAFTGTDTRGQTHALDGYKGKWVVLEWHNEGCPYVVKHYDTGNMQKLQQKATGDGVIWLTIISSAPGQQGHQTADSANTYFARHEAAPTAVLLDPTGTIGRAYDAKTTPHMYIIDPEGRLVYNGAIDDKPTTDTADVPGATNYVANALAEALAGKAITTAATKPYGCSVKYATSTENQ